jgi:hypothetical protein
MAFTDWSTLYSTMLDDLASGSWKVKAYTLPDGRSTTYRDITDYLKFLEYAKNQSTPRKIRIVGGTPT